MLIEAGRQDFLAQAKATPWGGLVGQLLVEGVVRCPNILLQVLAMVIFGVFWGTMLHVLSSGNSASWYIDIACYVGTSYLLKPPMY